uniref:Uncharacterized protein n=1 Tax=Acinetobacter lwoffii TaxID=28090 RepID=A0A385L152_ACILW
MLEAVPVAGYIGGYQGVPAASSVAIWASLPVVLPSVVQAEYEF